MAANVITQGAGVVLGLQPKFDWKAVAQTAIAAPIAWAVGNAVGGKIAGVANSN